MLGVCGRGGGSFETFAQAEVILPFALEQLPVFLGQAGILFADPGKREGVVPEIVKLEIRGRAGGFAG